MKLLDSFNQFSFFINPSENTENYKNLFGRVKVNDPKSLYQFKGFFFFRN